MWDLDRDAPNYQKREEKNVFIYLDKFGRILLIEMLSSCRDKNDSDKPYKFVCPSGLQPHLS